MNAEYDRTSAANALQELASERQSNVHSGFQLSRDTKNGSHWPRAYNVITKNDQRHLIVTGSNKKGAKESNEVVAHIQGILWKHDLPPFRNESITASRARFLRQAVSLTGLGTATFDLGMQGVLDVYAMFSSHVPRESLKTCENCNTYGEHTSIDISNRYFTSVRNAINERSVSFSKDEDPLGLLARLESPNYIHCESNVVEYFERVTKSSGDLRYQKISPVRFSVGDIVEAQLIFLLVPAERNKYQMQMVLQSLTLLNNTFSQGAYVARVARSLWPNFSTPQSNFKRRIGYAEEEIVTARAKLARMDIDNNNKVPYDANSTSSEEPEESETPGFKDMSG
ncbi:hypothetical protein AX14_000592 [Amanita brunnescens Koide BX004]|nr:hypothetical protein AX14_000592 [Amanita brunnescens Koide BX004]